MRTAVKIDFSSKCKRLFASRSIVGCLVPGASGPCGFKGRDPRVIRHPSRLPHPTLSTAMPLSIFARDLCTWTSCILSTLDILSTDKLRRALPNSSIFKFLRYIVFFNKAYIIYISIKLFLKRPYISLDRFESTIKERIRTLLSRIIYYSCLEKIKYKLQSKKNIPKTMLASPIHLFLVWIFMHFFRFADIAMDWSDHALWWPQRNHWLTRTRSTLDQYGVAADASLHFTPMHKTLRVQLPDMRCLDCRVDFSVKTFNAVINLCKELGESQIY